jgi:hypothetical protein
MGHPYIEVNELSNSLKRSDIFPPPALISPLDHNVLLGRLIWGLGDAGFVFR